VNKSRRGASDWGRERAGRIAEGPRRRIAQRGGTYHLPEGVVWGKGSLQVDVAAVLGGAKAPPSDVEETRLPGAKRFFRCAKSLPAAARARVPHDGIDDLLDSRVKEYILEALYRGVRQILLGLDGAQFILEGFQILDEPGGQSLHGELLFLSGEIVKTEAKQREGARLEGLETARRTFVERIVGSRRSLASGHSRRGVE